MVLESHSSVALVDALRGLLTTASPTRARKAVRELIAVVDDGQALELAARFATGAGYSSELLLRQWPLAADPDGFCEHLLGPAFLREGRTELRVRRVASLRGLRHLTMVRTLHVDRCKEVADITDLAGLTGLVELDLGGCAAIEDLSPLSGLAALTRLSLHRCRKVTDVRALLTLSRLQHLDLSMTNVRSVDGFPAAFPQLLTLNMRGLELCDLPALTDIGALSASRIGAILMVDLPLMRSLRVLGGLPELRKLSLSRCLGVEDLPTHIVQLEVHGHPWTDLSPIKGMTSLKTADLYVNELRDISAIVEFPGLTGLGLMSSRRVEDWTPLLDLPCLQRIRFDPNRGLPPGFEPVLTQLLANGVVRVKNHEYF